MACSLNESDGRDSAARISALVAQLAAVEARLAQETNVEVDAVIDPLTQIPYLLRRAQDALRISEERCRQIVEATREGIWVVDTEFRTTYVNSRVAEMLGRPAEEILGRYGYEFADEANGARLKDAMVRRREGVVERYDACFRHSNGGEVWVIVSAVPLHDAAGRFTGAMGLLTDISERKSAEDALKRSEDRMRSLMGSLQDIVWSAASDGSETLFMSPAVETVYGRSPGEFYDNPQLWREVVHPDDLQKVGAAMAELFRTGAREHEYRIVRPDGTVRRVLDRAWAVRNDSGEIFRLDGIARDITAHRAAEEEAGLLRLQLFQTFEALPDNFYLVDRNWRFVYANPAAEALFGLQLQKLSGKVVYELFPPDAEFDYMAPLRQAAAKGIAVDFETYYAPFKRLLEVRAFPVSEGLAVTMRDSTAAREASRHKEAILEGMASHIALLDENGVIIQVNRAWIDFAEINGLRLPDAGVGCAYPAAARQAEGVAEGLEAVLTGELLRFEKEYSCTLASGAETWWRMVATPVSRNRGRGGAVVVHSDVTQAKLVQFALAESEQRYALAAEGANDGLFDWNLQTETLFIAPRWKQVVGYGPDELSADPDEWLSRIHPEEEERVRIEFWRKRDPGLEKLECEFRMRHRDGSYRWVLCRAVVVCDPSSLPLRLVGSISDVTDRKTYEARLAFDAMHDALTGLPNRTLFTERLERAVERRRRGENYHYAVLFVDLDNFKHVNDGLGHQIGDLLLVELARRIAGCVKPRDTVARMGGDEFAVLVDEIGGDSAAVLVSKRIQDGLALPFSISGRDIVTGASIGILVGTEAYSSATEVLRDADTAMYRAKSAGRSGYAIFDSAMHAAALTRLETENDLYRALERDEFEVHYQPIVHLATGVLEGFEALVRWRHPTRGLVAPVEFISLAEETGQIVAIGEWVALEACRSLKRWQGMMEGSTGPPLRISINVSARQFSFPDLPERLEAIVGEAGLAAQCVNLELTETALLTNPPAAHGMLDQLRGAGFHLHLDDFGTGFSSLSHLHQFPIDTVKIDRSFVRGICDKPRNRELVRGIVNLAAGLELDVVAEGVETPEQAEALKALGCRYVQGYYYSRPMPLDDVERRWIGVRQNP